MKVLFFLIALLIPPHLFAQEETFTLGPPEYEMTGVWETGERFRAKLLFSLHKLGLHPLPKDPILLEKPPGTFQSGYAILRIYTVNEDGSQVLTIEKPIGDVFDTGNTGHRISLSAGSNDLITLKYSGYGPAKLPDRTITIVKYEDQFVVGSYHYSSEERSYVFKSDGSYEITDKPSQECFIDLLTGQRMVNDRFDWAHLPGYDEEKLITLEEWHENLPFEIKLCPFEIALRAPLPTLPEIKYEP